MMKNDWVRRSWVPIQQSFSPLDMSTFWLSFYNVKLIHVRDVFCGLSLKKDTLEQCQSFVKQISGWPLGLGFPAKKIECYHRVQRAHGWFTATGFNDSEKQILDLKDWKFFANIRTWPELLGPIRAAAGPLLDRPLPRQGRPLCRQILQVRIRSFNLYKALLCDCL